MRWSVQSLRLKKLSFHIIDGHNRVTCWYYSLHKCITVLLKDNSFVFLTMYFDKRLSEHRVTRAFVQFYKFIFSFSFCHQGCFNSACPIILFFSFITFSTWMQCKKVNTYFPQWTQKTRAIARITGRCETYQFPQSQLLFGIARPLSSTLE